MSLFAQHALLKANPYHDKDGNFTDKAHAVNPEGKHDVGTAKQTFMEALKGTNHSYLQDKLDIHHGTSLKQIVEEVAAKYPNYSTASKAAQVYSELKKLGPHVANELKMMGGSKMTGHPIHEAATKAFTQAEHASAKLPANNVHQAGVAKPVAAPKEPVQQKQVWHQQLETSEAVMSALAQHGVKGSNDLKNKLAEAIAQDQKASLGQKQTAVMAVLLSHKDTAGKLNQKHVVAVHNALQETAKPYNAKLDPHAGNLVSGKPTVPVTPSKGKEPDEATLEQQLHKGYKKYEDFTEHVQSVTNGKVSPAEHKAIENYQGSSYRPLNAALRGQKMLDASLATLIPHLDAAISRSQITENTMVWRGVEDFQAVFKMSPDKVKSMVGHVIVDNGFVSTSTSPHFAAGWINKNPGGVVLEYRLPKGFKGLNPFKYTKDMLGEAELLLGRGHAMKVVSVRAKNGVSFVTMEPM